MRLFIAIDLPDPVRAAIAALQTELKGSLSQAGHRGNLAWTRAETLHLTVKFLGDCPDARPIIADLGPAVAAHEPFDLEVSTGGAFPGGRSARVLWIGVHGEPRSLELLAEDVEAVLEPLGFPREKRPFRAHITIARVRPGGRIPLETVERLTGTGTIGRTRVRELVLYESHLHPTGAVHTPVHRFPLRGRGSGLA